MSQHPNLAVEVEEESRKNETKAICEYDHNQYRLNILQIRGYLSIGFCIQEIF